ncbi:16S rRNA (guanine(527)-N(7))-methyltransferase RsmG, partial [Mycoplasma nasistruthionis]
MDSKEIVKELCVRNNWDFDLFQKYVDLIEEKNKVMNLTGFYGERLWNEGILESLLFMQKITEGLTDKTILDIGAGAGFPSIPYVLTKPNNFVVIYEPLQKRVDFLNLVINELNLEKYVQVYKIRSEEEQQKNLYDVVTARAVANINALLMSSFHLVKVGGKLSLLKGVKWKEELDNAEKTLKMLSYELEAQEFNNTYIER